MTIHVFAELALTKRRSLELLVVVFRWFWVLKLKTYGPDVLLFYDVLVV